MENMRQRYGGLLNSHQVKADRGNHAK